MKHKVVTMALLIWYSVPTSGQINDISFLKVDSLIQFGYFNEAWDELSLLRAKSAINDLSTIEFETYNVHIHARRRQFAECDLGISKIDKLLSLTDSSHIRARYLWVRGWVSYLKYQFDAALIDFEASREIYRKLGVASKSWVAICDHWIGNVYAHGFYMFDVAGTYYVTALSELGKEEQDPRFFALLYDLARHRQNELMLEESLVYLTRAESFYNKAPQWRLEQVNCMNIRAIDKMYRRKVNEAIEIEKKAIWVAAMLDRNDLVVLGKLYDNLATFYFIMGKKESAHQYYKKGLSVNLGHRNNDYQTASSYLNLGAFLMDSNRDLADVYIRENLVRITALFGMKHFETAASHLHLGEFYLKMNRYDSALMHFHRSLVATVPAFNSADFADNPSQLPPAFAQSFFSILEGKARSFQLLSEASKDYHFLELALRTVNRADSLVNVIGTILEDDDPKIFARQNLLGLFEVGLSSCVSLYEHTGKEQYLDNFLKLRKAQKTAS